MCKVSAEEGGVKEKPRLTIAPAPRELQKPEGMERKDGTKPDETEGEGGLYSRQCDRGITVRRTEQLL